MIFNSETHPAATTMAETVEYNIEIDRRVPFKTVNTLLIREVISEGSVDLPIHFTKEVKDLIETTSVLRLISPSGKERRYYKLFYKEKE